MDFSGGTPGERFTDRYRKARAARHPLAKPFSLAGGVALVLLGAVMIVTPGPGLLLILLGAALIAGESHRLARYFDRLELALRARLGRARR